MSSAAGGSEPEDSRTCSQHTLLTLSLHLHHPRRGKCHLPPSLPAVTLSPLPPSLSPSCYTHSPLPPFLPAVTLTLLSLPPSLPAVTLTLLSPPSLTPSCYTHSPLPASLSPSCYTDSPLPSLSSQSRSRTHSNADYTLSKLNLVDLAGSERLSKTNVSIHHSHMSCYTFYQ